MVLAGGMLLTMLLTAQANEAREIVLKANDMVNLASMEMNATLKIYDAKGNVRIRKVKDVTRTFNEIVKTKITFLSPADVAGTTMLIYDYKAKDDDMWIYLPSMRNTRRIVSSDKGKNFMGSEFSNADMSKPNPDDYTYSVLGSKNYSGKDCWMVESICKTEAIADGCGYSRKISYIEKSTSLTHRMEFFNADNILFKVMTFNEYKKMADGYFACYMEIKNLANGRRSEMVVDVLKSGSDLNETSFSAVNLGK